MAGVHCAHGSGETGRFFFFFDSELLFWAESRGPCGRALNSKRCAGKRRKRQGSEAHASKWVPRQVWENWKREEDGEGRKNDLFARRLLFWADTELQDGGVMHVGGSWQVHLVVGSHPAWQMQRKTTHLATYLVMPRQMHDRENPRGRQKQEQTGDGADTWQKTHCVEAPPTSGALRLFPSLHQMFCSRAAGDPPLATCLISSLSCQEQTSALTGRCHGGWCQGLFD